MKRTDLALPALLAVFLLLDAQPARSEDDSAWASFADSLMSTELAQQHIPGAVLVVVRDGRVAFARGYGFADLERRTPVDAERTIFRVASVSKVFTATAAMQLVDQGKLDLHADVNTYLRRFRVPATYPRPVTLFDLLTHTAGFDDSNIARKAHKPGEVGPLGDYLARRLPARVRPPGETIVYSNHGMALAGYLVEVASGMPFDRYVHERIFAPLRMAHSSFQLTPDSVAQMATGYAGNPPRRQAPDYTRTIPASMLSASGLDVARFMIAHLESDTVLLSRASLDAMHRHEFSQDPELAGIGFGFWERYQNGVRALWHDGDASGFASLLYLLPEKHTGYFMAFNSRAGNRARREILAALLNREFPYTAEPPPADDRGAAMAARIAGPYVDMRYGHTTMEKIASLAEQEKLALGAKGTLLLGGGTYVPLSERVFQSKDGWGHLAYRMDHAGNVTHVFEARSIAHSYERVPWYGTVAAQLGWLAFCVLGFLWWLAVAAFRALFRRAQGQSSRLTSAITLVSILDLLFLVGLGSAVAGVFGSLEYSIPPLLIVVLTIPWVATLITAAALWGFVKSGRRGGGSLVWALSAAIAFVPWLAYWNLLGYRF